MTTILDVKAPRGRCPIRDNDGHRCNQKHGHEGPHSAFGRRFTAGLLIREVKP